MKMSFFNFIYKDVHGTTYRGSKGADINWIQRG